MRPASAPWSLLKGEPIRCDLVFGKPLAYARGESRKAIAGEAASVIAGILASMARAADRPAQAGTPALDPIVANP
jgi:1-acyl-sn-glycerol-3-phosphate acyltransferase